MMPKVVLSDRRYTYCHDDLEGPFQMIDVHNVFIKKSKGGAFLLYLIIFLFLVYIWYILLIKEKTGTSITYAISLGLILFKLLQWKDVNKESVMIMPTFGVQLETHYRSGKITRRFISMSKILRPVLNECVTPVTCYWSLSLLLRGEDKLMLVFQESQLPVRMLVPIWQALCSATDLKERQSN